MDGELRDGGGISVAKCSVDSSSLGNCENFKNLNGKSVPETVVVIMSVDKGSVSVSCANGNSNAAANMLESNEGSPEGSKIKNLKDAKQYCVTDVKNDSYGKFGGTMDCELRDGGGVSEPHKSVDIGNSGNFENFGDLTGRSVPETLVVIKSAGEGVASVSSENGNRDANGNSNAAANLLESNEVSPERSKIKNLKDDKQYSVVDVKNASYGKFGGIIDCELKDGEGISEAQNSVDLGNSGNCENLRDLTGKSVPETLVVTKSAGEGVASVSSENGKRDANGNLNAVANMLESNEVSPEGSKINNLKYDRQYCVIDVKNGSYGKFGGTMDGELGDGGGTSEAQNSVDLSHLGNCEDIRDLTGENVPDTLVVTKSAGEGVASVSSENGKRDANGNSIATADVQESSKVSVDGSKIKDRKDNKQHCVIDVQNDANVRLGENLDGERVCRICHLSSDPSVATPPRAGAKTTTSTTAATVITSPPPATVDGLIQLGCGCKDDLGIVHAYCAESWFKLKGTRQCEICGESAQNVTGVGDNILLEAHNETGTAGDETNLSRIGRGCWRGQPFCNFLMSCLVIAFVLPWFLRVNMF